MTLILGAFWISVGLTLYGYAGFPLLVAVAGRILDRGVRKLPVTPKVSLLIAAYNEEESIEGRIENALACDYPEDSLEIIVASDGSSDGTEDIVSRIGSGRVRLLSLPRRGKAHALNEAARQSRGEILVFSDANSLFEPDGLRKLVRNFADPEVGGVAGHTGYVVREEGESAGRGEDLYWRYDSWLKGLESRTGSVVGAHGGMYAIRRELFQPLADAAVTDDFAISTGVVAQGRRLVFEPEARASEMTVKRSGREFQRRVRLMTRGLRSVLLRRSLLDPRKHGFYSVSLFSHKVLRRALSLVLPVLFVTSVALHARGALYLGAAAAQGLFYSLAAAGWALRDRKPGRWKVFYVPFFFCMANLASAVAIWNVIRGRRIEKWSPQRHESDPASDPNGAGHPTASLPDGKGVESLDGDPTVLPTGVRDALRRRGVRYCVLRRPGEEAHEPAHRLPGVHRPRARPLSSSPIRVAHILVHPEDAGALESTFREARFLRFPAVSAAFRSHLIGPSSAGRWIRVDVRTELRYGPGGLRTATPESRLLARTREESAREESAREESARENSEGPFLAPEDEIVDLVLHAVLESETISPSKARSLRDTVRRLRQHPVQGGRAAERVQQELAPAVTWDGLLRCAAEDDWTPLERRRSALGLHLVRSEGARSLASGGMAALRTVFSAPPFLALRSSGAIVTLMGPDGGGKTSVALDLARWLPRPPRLVYGGYRRPPHPSIPPVLFRPISFWARALWLRWLRALGHLVIVDRYVFDGWVDRNGLDPGRRTWRRRFLEWPFPEPDLVVVLDAPGEELYRRSGEHSPEALERMRRGYLALEQRIPGLLVVDATRPQEEVVAAVAGRLGEPRPASVGR